MKLPWVSRDSHDEMVAELRATVSELKAERAVLYDRLGLIGLGGPLFTKAEEPQQVEEQEEEDEQGDLRMRLQALARHPSKQRQAVKQYMVEEVRKRGMPPSVARIPAPVARINAIMDEVEAQGKQA